MTDRVTPRAGVIGLGAMGLQMARHLVARGFETAGTDIDEAAKQRAAAHGVRVCASAAEVAASADVVIVMVANDEQVDAVVRGSGLIERLAPGAVICIASSISPQTCRELASLAAKRDIGVLDTPVVLGQDAAEQWAAHRLCGR